MVIAPGANLPYMIWVYFTSGLRLGLLGWQPFRTSPSRHFGNSLLRGSSGEQPRIHHPDPGSSLRTRSVLGGRRR